MGTVSKAEILKLSVSERILRNCSQGSHSTNAATPPGLEVFTGCCRCETAGTQTYSLYFKCRQHSRCDTL